MLLFKYLNIFFVHIVIARQLAGPIQQLTTNFILFFLKPLNASSNLQRKISVRIYLKPLLIITLSLYSNQLPQCNVCQSLLSQSASLPRVPAKIVEPQCTMPRCLRSSRTCIINRFRSFQRVFNNICNLCWLGCNVIIQELEQDLSFGD